MPSDLPTLRKEVQDAASGPERQRRDAAFRAAVAADIRALFDDPAFPARRRSFGVIRKRLGVFDPGDPTLQAILLAMGAQSHGGDGDATLWELRAHTPPIVSKPRWSRIGGAALVAALILVVATILAATLTGQSALSLLERLLGESHAACISRAKGTFLEMLECHKHFNLLQRS